MDLYAERLTTWLPVVANGCEIQRANVTPSQWINRYVRVPYLSRALNDRFYSRYIIYPRVAKTFQGDVNHVLDHSYGHLLRALNPQRTIVTVHDLYPLHVSCQSALTPREQARKWLLRWVMGHALRARWLIAPSESTKRELLSLTDYPASRISVVHMGVDEVFFRPVEEEAQQQFRQALKVPEAARLLLHVGSCDPRKNIPLLLQGLKALLDRSGADFYLLQIGGRFAPDQIHLIHHLGLASQLRQRSNVSADELMGAYQAADVLLLPSTYEGFGLTALEAMASGTPVVASDIGALREVVGEAGVLVGLNDPAQLAAAVMTVLGDVRLRTQLVEKGRARAAAFRWSETARKTLAVYHRVYSERA
ncbi:MAG: glycosyltransferase family 4 protein [Acidobacteria bacterium]|nr:glycosyltransferase family 4 protein [Acidobacteriota bacterium]